ncbi:hypothetical protein [Paenibacillus sp. QZ-Y1]|uniref:hypothetical protein n=1 Tax=Paenibacillus sp. QZ-Y1 TaxID=3414511 RepID=UPI003F7A3973
MLQEVQGRPVPSGTGCFVVRVNEGSASGSDPSMLRGKKGTDIIRFKVNSGGWTAKGGTYIESDA